MTPSDVSSSATPTSGSPEAPAPDRSRPPEAPTAPPGARRREALEASRKAGEALPAEPRRALEWAELALARFGDDGTADERARAWRHVGVGSYFLGEHVRAAHAFTQALQGAREAGDPETETSALNGLAAVFHALGDLEGSLKCLEEVLGVARRIGHLAAEAAALINSANLQQDLGEFRYAIHLYTTVLAQPAIPSDFRATALNNRGNALRACGELLAAAAGHEEALALARADGLLQREPMFMGNLAETRLAQDDAAGAQRLLEEALALASARSLKRDRYKLLLLLGDSRWRQADRDDALRHFREARDCAAELGNPRDESEALNRIVGASLEAQGPAVHALWQRLNELQQQLQSADSLGRAQALAVRLQLQQTRHELQDTTRRAERMRLENEKLEANNRSLKQAMTAFGIHADRARAKPGLGGRALTVRELQVLRLMSSGLTNPAIAESLGLTRLTVRHYVSSILRKLEAESRTQAVASALREGLIPGP